MIMTSPQDFSSYRHEYNTVHIIIIIIITALQLP